jgi:general secretion pathway protein F
MALFRYKAVAADGAVVEGQLEAADQQGVIDRLHAMGQIPVRAEPLGADRSQLPVAAIDQRPSRRALDLQIVLARDLANLLNAGLPLDRALAVLIDINAEPATARMLGQLREQVRSGRSLSQALAAQPRSFSPLVVNLTRAGEAGGVLGAVLGRLAEYLERSRQLRESVKTALLYPGILFLVALVSVAVLLVFVVPQFKVLFADAGRALPLSTEIVISAGEFVRHYGVLALAALVVAGFAAARALRRPALRQAWDARVLRVPLLGEVLAKAEMARAARTLGTLLANGVTLPNALAISRDTLNNRAMAAAMDRINEGVRQGQMVGALMLESGLFPRLAGQMVRIGEETGQLQSMLTKVADLYDQDVERSIKRMLAVLEPALILSMAVFIAVIIISILLGILAANELVA